MNEQELKGRLIDHCQTQFYQLQELKQLIGEFEIHYYKVIEKDLMESPNDTETDILSNPRGWPHGESY